MKWINILHEQPKEGQYMLMYGTGGRQFTGLMKNGKMVAYNPFTDWIEGCEEVTHWMPLPNPPEDNE